jgi:hypothetical protein
MSLPSTLYGQLFGISVTDSLASWAGVCLGSGLAVQPWHLVYTSCRLYLVALLPLLLSFGFVVLV